MNIKTLGCSLLLFNPFISLQAATPQDSVIAQPQWKIQPAPNYANQDLENQNRKTTLYIMGNPEGKVIQTRVIHSSGVPALDKKVQDAVMVAKFLPYPHAFYVTQSFEMRLSPLHDNKIWLVKPHISHQNKDLQDQHRQITLELKRDNKGFIQEIEILQSTGLKYLDEKIIGQVKDSRLDPKTTPEKLKLPISLSSYLSEQESRKIVLQDDLALEDAAKIWRYFPSLNYSPIDLVGQNRHLSFSLSFDDAGNLAKSVMTQSSGLKALDYKIHQQIRTAQLYSHHAPVTLNIPIILPLKSTAAN